MPSEDVADSECIAPAKTIPPSGIGSLISLFFKHTGKKKKIRKGTKLFKVGLKKFGLDALHILPFVGGTLVS